LSEVRRSPEGRESFPCRQCGAALEYAPGADAQRCPYCGHEQVLDPPVAAVQELDLRTYLERAVDEAPTVEGPAVDCPSCGARTTLPANETAGVCPFCGTPAVAVSRSHRAIRPNALLPFGVDRDRALAAFRDWVRRLWFAPGRLRRDARSHDRLQGVYVPYWTYDCRATTDFEGLRGDAYWTTQTYTARVNGRSVTRTRQVRRIRWSPASGRVVDRFDDVLVLASGSLPRKHARALEPWDLAALVPYRDEYLSGFRAEAYQVGLADGFREATGIMEERIRRSVRSAIGGDTQQILSLRTRHEDLTFKHVLLPVWLSAYRSGGRTFRFLVNARTAEVQGERPWSWVKIALTALGGLALIAVLLWLMSL
jgi:DNA-directed RNA polymerase subunit RPC12/RpoP